MVTCISNLQLPAAIQKFSRNPRLQLRAPNFSIRGQPDLRLRDGGRGGRDVVDQDARDGTLLTKLTSSSLPGRSGSGTGPNQIADLKQFSSLSSPLFFP